jgi:hypothetical protein
VVGGHQTTRYHDPQDHKLRKNISFLLLHTVMFTTDKFVPYRETAPLDDLKQLANATGGQFFYVSDQDGVHGLLDALKAALELAQLQV